MNETEPVGAGILGASGYTGFELVRLLAKHPFVKLLSLGSRQFKGQRVADVFPAMPNFDLCFDDDATTPEAWLKQGIRVGFAALPHGAFAARARAFYEAGIALIDLSADFRLSDSAFYPKHYNLSHPDPDLLKYAEYGLCEWNAERIAKSRFVANPGCYTTASLLGILPALAADLWNQDPILINAVSGISGAGRGLRQATHFVEATNSVAPYLVGESHAHLGELIQLVGQTAHVANPQIVFNPHLVPMSRGICASIAIPLKRAVQQDEVQALYSTRYATAPFVNVLPSTALPETRHVRSSNRCDLSVRVAASGRMLLVFSTIDNLLKGAAGQAVQNLNIMMGWPETTSLPVEGIPYT